MTTDAQHHAQRLFKCYFILCPDNLENRAPITLWTATVVPKSQHLFSIAIVSFTAQGDCCFHFQFLPPLLCTNSAALVSWFFSANLVLLLVLGDQTWHLVHAWPGICCWPSPSPPLLKLAGLLLEGKRLGAIGILKLLKTRHFTDLVVFNQEKNLFIQIRCMENYLRALAM